MRRRHQRNNMEDLFTTVANSSVGGLEKYLQNGGLASLKSSNGVSLMHKAVKEDDEEKVKLLIQHNCDVNAGDDDDCTPLNVALNSGLDHILELLIDAKADVNTVSYQHTNPLIHAVLCENVTAVELILSKGANCDVNVQNYLGQIALIQAIMGQNKEICQLLLNYGASYKGVNGSKFQRISQKVACTLCSNTDLMKLFLTSTSDLDLHYHLKVACVLGKPTVAEMLLGSFDDPFQLKALGFIVMQETDNVWERFVKFSVKPYSLATKCCKENKLLTMLLGFCESKGCHRQRQTLRSRAILLIRVLVRYGLVIHEQTSVRDCHSECDCRKAICVALHPLNSVPSLKGQCCSVVRQSFPRHKCNFDLQKVNDLPLPRALKDFICMKDW